MRRLAAGMLGVAALAAAAPAGAADFPGFQADPAHSGHQAGESFRPPLTRVWSRDLGATVSYPVIAEGRVFVTTSRHSDHAAALVALDAASGETLWAQSLEPTDDGWTGASYGGGLVYAVNGPGLVRAFRPDTGAEVWRRQLEANVHAASPTYSDGVLFLSSITNSYEKVTDPEENATGGAYALRASDGAVLWRRPVIGGSSSSPSVDGSTFYANYTCGQVYALDRATGAVRWHRNPGCYGGGGRTTALYDGKLWVFEPDGRDFEVFDAASGALRRTVPPTHNPAFAGGIGVFARSDALVAEEVRTGRRLWSKPRGWPEHVGPQWSTPPLIAGGVVYEGTVEGVLYAFDLHSGEQLWSDSTGSGFAGDNPSSVADPTGGLGAGAGLLVAPHVRGVIAYRGQPGPGSGPGAPGGPPPGGGHGTGPGGFPACARVRATRRPRVVCKLRGAPAVHRRAPARLTRGRAVLARGTARTVRGALRAELVARGTQLAAGSYALRVSRRGGSVRVIVTVP